MKKLVKTLLCFVVLLTLSMGFELAASVEDEITVTLDGGVLTFDQNPVITEGRTLVPLRGIFEAMGADVSWDDEARCVTATKDSTEIKLTIGENTLYKNGEAITLDVPAQIVNSRTLVPARAVSESFGARVDWNGETRNVIISTDEVLNAALANAENVGEMVLDMNASISYAGFPVDATLNIGIDYRNQKFFTSYIINTALMKSQSASVNGEGKTYTDENGKVTVSTQQYTEIPSSFVNSEGSVYTFEGETDTERMYSIEDTSLSDTTVKVKFYVSKQTLTFTKVVFPKEIFEQFGVQTTGDIVAAIEYNTGRTMELWNKYNK